jgi:hypothetical protein
MSLANRPNQDLQLSGGGASQVHLKKSVSLLNGTQIATPSPHPEHSAQTPRSPRRRTFEPGELATSASESVSLPGRNRGGTQRAHENGTAQSTAQSLAAQRNRFDDEQVNLSAAAPTLKLDRFGQPRLNVTRSPASLHTLQPSAHLSTRQPARLLWQASQTRRNQRCASSPGTTSSYIRRHRRDGGRNQQSRE